MLLCNYIKRNILYPINLCYFKIETFFQHLKIDIFEKKLFSLMKKITLFCIVLLLIGCSKAIFNEKWLEEEVPESFKARFETTQGNFDIEAKREWSPQGVDRLYRLIKSGFYTDIAIYRVAPNFVAQFGIHDTKVLNDSWRTYTLDDEPVVKSNEEMTISFARGGVKSRTTQLFVNLKNNQRLDKLDYGGTKGFPVVAQVIEGKENIKKFYKGYGEALGRKQDSIQEYGNDFLRRKYPKVDYIVKAYILK